MGIIETVEDLLDRHLNSGDTHRLTGEQADRSCGLYEGDPCFALQEIHGNSEEFGYFCGMVTNPDTYVVIANATKEKPPESCPKGFNKES